MSIGFTVIRLGRVCCNFYVASGYLSINHISRYIYFLKEFCTCLIIELLRNSRNFPITGSQLMSTHWASSYFTDRIGHSRGHGCFICDIGVCISF